MAKICGIYCIENKINQRKYIGQSVDIYRRWNTHKYKLRYSKHYNTFLQNSWNKYGEENFSFYIVEECCREELNDKEIYWIQYYDSCKNGYNADRGGARTTSPIVDYVACGEDSPNAVLTEQNVLDIIERLKIPESPYHIALDYGVSVGTITHIRDHKSWKHLTRGIEFDKYSKVKAIDVYTKHGIFLQTYDSAIIVERELGVKYSVVLGVCNGEKCTASGYIFRFHGHAFDEYRTIRNFVQMVQIDQYDLNWNLVHTYISITEARKITGIKNISNVLLGKRRSAGGYYWLRHGDPIPENGIVRKTKCKPVDQYTLDGEYVNTYKSSAHASQETGISDSGICAVLHGRYKTSGGFYWTYHSDDLHKDDNLIA